jgi:hypothetical protein
MMFSIIELKHEVTYNLLWTTLEPIPISAWIENLKNNKTETYHPIKKLDLESSPNLLKKEPN